MSLELQSSDCSNTLLNEAKIEAYRSRRGGGVERSIQKSDCDEMLRQPQSCDQQVGAD
jgi:hypothetical protein